MKSLFVSLAALAVHSSLVAAAPRAYNFFEEGDLTELSPDIVANWKELNVLDVTPTPVPPVSPTPAPTASPSPKPAAPVSSNDANTTTCGAVQYVAAADAPMYISATAIFSVAKVSARPAFNWTKDPTVTPRIAVSAGLDGFSCPETMRAGIYATVTAGGEQQQMPFLKFSGRYYGVNLATVAAGELVKVQVTMVTDSIVNVNWSNLNRTDQFFEKDIPTQGSMCGKSVSWLVEDLVPTHAAAGEYFASFDPVHFSLLEGKTMDGKTTSFSAATSSFTTEKQLCKVDEAGQELVVSST